MNMTHLKVNKQLAAIIICILLPISLIKAQTQIDSTNFNSVFWEISGNGLEKPSFLFGTIHLIPEKDYVFSNTMQTKFDASQILVLEVNIDMSLKEQIEIAKKVILPGAKKLNEFMTEKQFSDFKSYLLDTLKIKKAKFKKILRIKPIFSMALVLSELIEDPIAYEQKFTKEAKKRKMEIQGLETIEFQMSLMDSISIEEQIKMLVEDDMGNSNPLEEYYKILEAYKHQDLKKLYDFFKEDEEFESMEADFLIKRNIKWISGINNIIKKQAAFIAVGAGHLYGEEGLVLLLRKEGYTLKALRLNQF